MTSSEYVTGWSHAYVPPSRRERTMAGPEEPVLRRTPHAILAGSGEPPVTAVCGAQVDEVSAIRWPPGQSPVSMRVPCGVCSRQVPPR